MWLSIETNMMLGEKLGEEGDTGAVGSGSLG
jgi:hypothetical protein